MFAGTTMLLAVAAEAAAEAAQSEHCRRNQLACRSSFASLLAAAVLACCDVPHAVFHHVEDRGYRVSAR